MRRRRSTSPRDSRRAFGAESLTTLANFLVGFVVALLALAAPESIAIPFGATKLAELICIAAFALGLVLARERTDASREGALRAACLVLVAILFFMVVGRPAARWVAANWPLPQPGATPTHDSPLPIVLVAIALLVPLGSCVARMMAALRLTTPGIATFLGAACGLVLHPLVVLRTLGITGAIGIAGVALLLAAAIQVLAPPREQKRASPSLALSCAIGLGIGVIGGPLDLAGGGTSFSVVFPAILAVLGAAFSELLWPFVAARSRGVRALAACGLMLVFAYAVGSFPSATAILESSVAVAATIDGRIPSLSSLSPLPLVLALIAFLGGFARCLGSPRAIGVALLAAMGAQMFAHFQDSFRAAMSVAAALSAASAIAAIRASRATRERGNFESRALALCCGVIAVFAALVFKSRFEIAGRSIANGREVNTARELDGDRFEWWADDPSAAAFANLNGCSLRSDLPMRTATDALVAQVLAWGGEPLSCVVLGPCGLPWIESLLALTNLRIDYVTPLQGEATLIAESKILSSSRLHTLVASPRRYLESSTRKYDRVVIVPPAPPWRESFASRTSEFRDRACAHLNDSGIVAELFSPASMSRQNFYSRVLVDAATDRPDGVVLVDRPSSLDPQIALIFGSVPPRFDLRRVASSKTNGPSDPNDVTDAMREALLGVVCGARALKIDSHLLVIGHDDRPWLSGALRAYVPPTDGFAVANLVSLAKEHGMVEDRLDGLTDGREAFLASARRDYEAMHVWYAQRSTLAADRSQPDRRSGSARTKIAPPVSRTELDVLEKSLAKSPDLEYLRRVLLSEVNRLTSSGEVDAASDLVDRLCDMAFSYVKQHPEAARSAGVREIAFARARLFARQFRRKEAIFAFERMLDDEKSATLARVGLGCLLAYSGRDDRARARELLNDLPDAEMLAPELRLEVATALAFARGDKAAAKAAIAAREGELDSSGSSDPAMRYVETWFRR